MKITIIYGPSRRKPKVGDRKIIRGVEHIRVFSYVTNWRGDRIGLDCTGGKQRYEWVPVSEARAHGAGHHWTKEERAKYDDKHSPGYMQGRGAA
jgi:hypothetical protein